jgi:hypothetical protein
MGREKTEPGAVAAGPDDQDCRLRILYTPSFLAKRHSPIANRQSFARSLTLPVLTLRLNVTSRTANRAPLTFPFSNLHFRFTI